MDNESPLKAFRVAPMLLFIGTLAIAIFVIDTLLPLDSAIAVLYAIVVLLAANHFQERGAILWVSGGCLALTVFSFLVQHNLKADAALVRCLVSLSAIGATTFVALKSTRLYRDLADREAKVRRLVEANIIGIFVCDLQGRISEANDAFLRIIGYDREDLAWGRVRWDEFTPAEWRERGERTRAELSAHGTVQPFEKEYFRKDGSRVPVLIGAALFERGGNEGVAFVLDLTERKRAENALRESEERFRDYAETASDWLWEMGPDHKLTMLTSNAFGSSPSARLGTAAWERALDLETEPDKWRAIRATMDSHQPFRDFVYLAPGGDGSPMYVRASGKPVFDAGGEFLGYRGVGTDATAIIRAQEALRESERKFRDYAETGSDWFWEASPEAKLTAVSGNAYGANSSAIIGTHVANLALDRETEPEKWRELRSTVGSRKPFRDFIYLEAVEGGSPRYVKVGGKPVFDGSGEFLGYRGTSTDVTAMVRAQVALRESEQSFRDYAETASDWFWEIGPDYRFTLLTENAFGSDPAKRIGTACWDHALDLETEPEKWRNIQAALDARKPFRDFVYRGIGGGGSPIYVKASGKPVFDADGKFRGYRGTGSDVTAIIRAEQALRESESSLRLIIDTLPALAWSARPDGSAEFFNQQYLAYVGYPAEELLNWGWTVAVHPDDLSGLAATWQALLAAGKPGEAEARLRRHDGEYRLFLLRAAPLRDDDGNIVKWYGFNTDIEDRTRALARMQQMQSDFAHMNRVSNMGELAASLSHEIAQPIGSARNNARAALNFLDREPPDLSEVREALGCIVNDSDRAGNIIGRIRDQIRKAPPRKDHFDLNAAITEVIGLARSAITRNGVSVQTRLAEQLHSVDGDRVQLQQVVLNLVLNAVEAMGSVDAGARELLLSTEQGRAGVLVAVCDSGPGIDPARLESVFEPFYTTKPSGTGMGLSICRSIIDAHGGRLWAEANEPRGAVFQFTLPGAESRS